MRHRWFMASCIVMILMGVAHVVAANVAPPPKHEDPRGEQLMTLMKEYQLPQLNRTMHEISVGFSVFFEMAAVAMGVAGFVVARQTVAARRLAMVYAVALAAMLVNSIVHWFFIPTSFLGASLALCVISLVPAPTKESTP